MKSKLEISKKDMLEEIKNRQQVSENSIENIFTKYMGVYQPDKFSPKVEPKQEVVSKETEMGEGKLFTKFILSKK
jgi:hypothetical protein